MKAIWTFQHTRRGPGYLADFLVRHGHPIVSSRSTKTTWCLTRGYAGLVFMGGPMSVNDDLPWIQSAPSDPSGSQPTGRCWDIAWGQLLSNALAASCAIPSGIGWLPVEQVDGPRARMADGLNRDSTRSTGTAKPSACRRALVTSKSRLRESGVYRQKPGLQCHVEMTAAMVRD